MLITPLGYTHKVYNNKSINSCITVFFLSEHTAVIRQVRLILRKIIKLRV